MASSDYYETLPGYQAQKKEDQNIKGRLIVSKNGRKKNKNRQLLNNPSDGIKPKMSHENLYEEPSFYIKNQATNNHHSSFSNKMPCYKELQNPLSYVSPCENQKHKPLIYPAGYTGMNVSKSHFDQNWNYAQHRLFNCRNRFKEGQIPASHHDTLSKRRWKSFSKPRQPSSSNFFQNQTKQIQSEESFCSPNRTSLNEFQNENPKFQIMEGEVNSENVFDAPFIYQKNSKSFSDYLNRSPLKKLPPKITEKIKLQLVNSSSSEKIDKICQILTVSPEMMSHACLSKPETDIKAEILENERKINVLELLDINPPLSEDDESCHDESIKFESFRRINPSANSASLNETFFENDSSCFENVRISEKTRSDTKSVDIVQGDGNLKCEEHSPVKDSKNLGNSIGKNWNSLLQNESSADVEKGSGMKVHSQAEKSLNFINSEKCMENVDGLAGESIYCSGETHKKQTGTVSVEFCLKSKDLKDSNLIDTCGIYSENKNKSKKGYKLVEDIKTVTPPSDLSESASFSKNQEILFENFAKLMKKESLAYVPSCERISADSLEDNKTHTCRLEVPQTHESVTFHDKSMEGATKDLPPEKTYSNTNQINTCSKEKSMEKNVTCFEVKNTFTCENYAGKDCFPPAEHEEITNERIMASHSRFKSDEEKWLECELLTLKKEDSKNEVTNMTEYSERNNPETVSTYNMGARVDNAVREIESKLVLFHLNKTNPSFDGDTYESNREKILENNLIQRSTNLDSCDDNITEETQITLLHRGYHSLDVVKMTNRNSRSNPETNLINSVKPFSNEKKVLNEKLKSSKEDISNIEDGKKAEFDQRKSSTTLSIHPCTKVSSIKDNVLKQGELSSEGDSSNVDAMKMIEFNGKSIPESILNHLNSKFDSNNDNMTDKDQLSSFNQESVFISNVFKTLEFDVAKNLSLISFNSYEEFYNQDHFFEGKLRQSKEESSSTEVVKIKEGCDKIIHNLNFVYPCTEFDNSDNNRITADKTVKTFEKQLMSFNHEIPCDQSLKLVKLDEEKHLGTIPGDLGSKLLSDENNFGKLYPKENSCNTNVKTTRFKEENIPETISTHSNGKFDNHKDNIKGKQCLFSLNPESAISVDVLKVPEIDVGMNPASASFDPPTGFFSFKKLMHPEEENSNSLEVVSIVRSSEGQTFRTNLIHSSRKFDNCLDNSSIKENYGSSKTENEQKTEVDEGKNSKTPEGQTPNLISPLRKLVNNEENNSEEEKLCSTCLSSGTENEQNTEVNGGKTSENPEILIPEINLIHPSTKFENKEENSSKKEKLCSNHNSSKIKNALKTKIDEIKNPETISVHPCIKFCHDKEDILEPELLFSKNKGSYNEVINVSVHDVGNISEISTHSPIKCPNNKKNKTEVEYLLCLNREISQTIDGNSTKFLKTENPHTTFFESYTKLLSEEESVFKEEINHSNEESSGIEVEIKKGFKGGEISETTLIYSKFDNDEADSTEKELLSCLIPENGSNGFVKLTDLDQGEKYDTWTSSLIASDANINSIFVKEQSLSSSIEIVKSTIFNEGETSIIDNSCAKVNCSGANMIKEKQVSYSDRKSSRTEFSKVTDCNVEDSKATSFYSGTPFSDNLERKLNQELVDLIEVSSSFEVNTSELSEGLTLEIISPHSVSKFDNNKDNKTEQEQSLTLNKDGSCLEAELIEFDKESQTPSTHPVLKFADSKDNMIKKEQLPLVNRDNSSTEVQNLTELKMKNIPKSKLFHCSTTFDKSENDVTELRDQSCLNQNCSNIEVLKITDIDKNEQPRTSSVLPSKKFSNNEENVVQELLSLENRSNIGIQSTTLFDEENVLETFLFKGSNHENEIKPLSQDKKSTMEINESLEDSKSVGKVITFEDKESKNLSANETFLQISARSVERESYGIVQSDSISRGNKKEKPKGKCNILSLIDVDSMSADLKPIEEKQTNCLLDFLDSSFSFLDDESSSKEVDGSVEKEMDKIAFVIDTGVTNISNALELDLHVLPLRVVGKIMSFCDGDSLLNLTCISPYCSDIVNHLYPHFWKACCRNEIPSDCLEELLSRLYPRYWCSEEDSKKINWSLVYKNWNDWKTSTFDDIEKIYESRHNITCLEVSGFKILIGSIDGLFMLDYDNLSFDTLVSQFCVLQAQPFADPFSPSENRFKNRIHDKISVKYRSRYNAIIDLHKKKDLRGEGTFLYECCSKWHYQNKVVSALLLINEKPRITLEIEENCKVIQKTVQENSYDHLVGLNLWKDRILYMSLSGDIVIRDDSLRELVRHKLPDKLILRQVYSFKGSVLIGITAHNGLYAFIKNKDVLFSKTTGLCSPITAVDFYLNMLMIGTYAGRIYLYVLKSEDDLLNLNFEDFDAVYNIFSSRISLLKFHQTIHGPGILAVCGKDVYRVNFYSRFNYE